MSVIYIMVRPLGHIEIVKKIGCKFIAYEDMYRVNSIKYLLPKTLILYQLAYIGHFCCVFINAEGINFFDPIGTNVDEWLFVTRNKKYSKHHDFTYLTKLFVDSGMNIIYNEHCYQDPGANTCGYWCATRMKYSHLYNDQFYNIFKNIAFNDNKIKKIYDTII